MSFRCGRCGTPDVIVDKDCPVCPLREEISRLKKQIGKHCPGCAGAVIRMKEAEARADALAHELEAEKRNHALNGQSLMEERDALVLKLGQAVAALEKIGQECDAMDRNGGDLRSFEGRVRLEVAKALAATQPTDLERVIEERRLMEKVIEAAKNWNPTVRGGGPHLIPQAQALVDAVLDLKDHRKQRKEADHGR